MNGIVASLVVAAIVLAGSAGPTSAQSGNTGGTIGKKDKVITGGESPARKPPRQPRTTSAATPKAGGCRAIVGNWHFTNNVGVVFKADGTNSATNGDTGTWTCKSGMYSVSWKSFGHTDRLTLSSDSKSLSGTGMFGTPLLASRK